MRLRAGLAALALPAVLAAGCAGSSGAGHAAASASAFATSAPIRHDELIGLRRLAHCSASGTGGQLLFTVSTAPAAGQASIPGVANKPHIQITHVSIRLAHHLSVKVHSVIDCAVPPSKRAAVKACAARLSLPLPPSTQAVTVYLTGIADCMARPQ
jgi:hypothetical protein